MGELLDGGGVFRDFGDFRDGNFGDFTDG